jgi:hypothetical protein
VEIALRERGFRMLNTLRKMLWPNCEHCSFGGLCKLFSIKILNGSTNVFRVVEITLNRNKRICYFLEIFYLFFHASPGTLLPDLV